MEGLRGETAETKDAVGTRMTRLQQLSYTLSSYKVVDPTRDLREIGDRVTGSRPLAREAINLERVSFLECLDLVDSLVLNP